MNKNIDQFDIKAEIESIAIARSYKPHTMDFGGRLKKTSIAPACLVRKISRKVCRNRTPRQIDMRKEKLKQETKELKNRKRIKGIQL